ncbi:MAG: hypothetical protein ISN29_05490 [Gammaproteobacteria bacterium AqS3]|nr:hypothetical protein [Gammaproteobacteria bacterium AqS3]
MSNFAECVEILSEIVQTGAIVWAIVIAHKRLWQWRDIEKDKRLWEEKKIRMGTLLEISKEDLERLIQEPDLEVRRKSLEVWLERIKKI